MKHAINRTIRLAAGAAMLAMAGLPVTPTGAQARGQADQSTLNNQQSSLSVQGDSAQRSDQSRMTNTQSNLSVQGEGTSRLNNTRSSLSVQGGSFQTTDHATQVNSKSSVTIKGQNSKKRH